MRKIPFFLLLILILPLVSAASIDMKSEFDQGGTLMAKISGNFINPIFEENIFLYRGHIGIPLGLEIAKISGDYYVYAQLLGKPENNYSLHIKDIMYMRAGQVVDEDIIKNFSISNKTVDFSIEPGFVITETDFFIEAQNLQNHSITLKINENKSDAGNESEGGFFDFLFGDEENGEEGRFVTLGTGETKKLDFNITNITESTLKLIEISTENSEYEVPVYVFIEGEAPSEEKEKSFIFSPVVLNFSMATDSQSSRIVYLYNDGEADLENIGFYISDTLEPYVSLSIEEIDELEANESIRISIDFFSDIDEGALEGEIIANSSGLYAYLAVFLNFIKDYEPLPGEENQTVPDPAILKTCGEMGGTICVEGEECSEDTEPAIDGNCCLGTCEEVKESSKGKIIGWVIIIVIIILVLWFLKVKYKRTRRRVDLLKIARGRKR